MRNIQFINSHCEAGVSRRSDKPQGVGKLRKVPRQARAIATVDAILEASAQILSEGDKSQLTTNYIAERAGVSIGTLYQYFEDTNAILIRLANRENKAIADQVVAEISQVEVGGAEQTTRNVIRFLIKTCSDQAMLRRLIVLSMIQSLRTGRDERLLNAVAETIAGKLAEPDMSPSQDQEMYSFILTRSVLNIIRSAMIERPAYLASPDFEDMLVEMAMAFRTAHRGGTG